MSAEEKAARHLVALYDERVAMTKAVAEHERPTGQMADAVLAKGADLNAACEEFRRKFYPRRHRVFVGSRIVFSVSRTRRSMRTILDGNVAVPSVAPSATAMTASLTATATTPVGVVEEWHAQVHRGAFWTCLEQPCHAVEAVRR